MRKILILVGAIVGMAIIILAAACLTPATQPVTTTTVAVTTTQPPTIDVDGICDEIITLQLAAMSIDYYVDHNGIDEVLYEALKIERDEYHDRVEELAAELGSPHNPYPVVIGRHCGAGS